MDVTRKAEATPTPEVVDLARFQRELDKLRSREKAHTRAGDAIEARYRGDAPSTSGSLDARACHVWTIRDGKLAAFQQYTDTCSPRSTPTSPLPSGGE